MIYLLYGKEEYLINEEIKNIIKNNNIYDMNISKYDLLLDNINLVINDAASISLLSDKKLIIVNNSICFETAKSIDTTLLEQYFNNINENTIIVFIVNKEKLDERRKVTKIVRKIGIVKEYNNINTMQFAKTLFDEYQITDSLIKLLIDRVGDNITLLSNEIKKIKLYKGNDLNITQNDILNLTVKSLEPNNFKLIDAIILKDKNLAISLYNERLKLNEEPIAIIIALANQIRIMYQVKQLYIDGYTENNIANILKIHPYRIKLAYQNSKKYDSKLLLKYLYELALLDIDIKSGKIDKKLGLELFILSI